MKQLESRGLKAPKGKGEDTRKYNFVETEPVIALGCLPCN